MSGTTSVYAFPYQGDNDPPDGPSLGQDLAERVEAVLHNGVEALTVGSVSTTGAVAAGGALTVGGTAAVTGNTTITGNLTVTGNLTAAGIGARILKIKSTAESVISNTTPQDDDELFIPLPINTTWAITGFVNASCTNPASDFKLAFTVPAGATFRVFANNTAGANSTEFSTSGAVASFALDTVANNQIWIQGYVKCGATPGNFQFQWAQAGSVATNTFVNAGSWLRGDR